MKSLMVFALLAVVPLVVLSASVSSNATSASISVQSEQPEHVETIVTNPLRDAAAESHASPQEHSATTELPSQTPTTIKQKLNGLHRVPIFENRNPLVETISELTQTHANVNETTSEEKTVVDQSTVNKTSDQPAVELPIPSRCPHITGTSDEEMKKANFMESTRPKAAQRGCRFFIMHELIDRNQKHDEWALLTSEQQMNQTLEKCYSSCAHAYDNGTTLNDACAEGCLKTAKVTEVAKEFLGPMEESESESELEREQNVPSHRTFSIIIPIRPMTPEKDEEEQDGDNSNKNADSFPSMMPNAIRMMLNMMHQMTDRARQSMMGQQTQDSGLLSSNGQSNMQESEMSVDPSGNSISISRSMSVLMTKDKDGHSKMVVVHTLPKVLIHHFGQNPFDNDQTRPSLDNLLSDPREHSTSSSNGDDDNDDLFGDNDQFRFKLFGHLSNGGAASQHQHNHFGHSATGDDDDSESTTSSSSTQVYYYRTRLCYYLPRLFYLTVLILVLYVIFWLLCAVPQAILGGGAANNRRASPAGVAIISTATGVNGKCRKFLFTKSQKYFQLNNKRNSTTSLPPPYPGAEDSESCAEPLPEKQPIPDGGIEVGVPNQTTNNTITNNADK